MLIGFCGSPRSGKTTLALKLAGCLKERGHAVDFLPEKARDFIRTNKCVGKDYLEHYDQKAIYDSQREVEGFLEMLNGPCYNITDGSSVNSLFYLSKYNGGTVSGGDIEKEADRYDLLIVCDLIRDDGEVVADNNRIHDLEFSVEMHESLVEKAKVSPKSLFVTGGVRERLNTVMGDSRLGL